MFNKVSAQCEVQGKKIQVETGRLARQADGAVYVTCGDNSVLVSVVSSKSKSQVDFFPLTVEYQEKFYSVGRFPGGFFKREGRPTSETTLKARLIDRPIRPCFPDGYRNETQVAATVLSSDGQFPLEILAGIGASTALHISDIPFEGPVGFMKIASRGGEFILNPQEEQEEAFDMEFIVAGTQKGLLMVEGDSQFISEKQALDALKFAHQSMESVFKMQEELRQKTGNKSKREVIAEEIDPSLAKNVTQFIEKQMEQALQEKDKVKRYGMLDELKQKALEEFVKEGEEDLTSSVVKTYEDVKYKVAREMITQKSSRIDGRKMSEVRPIACEAGVLARAHGSALFTRGETQVLGVVTLGTGDDEKIIDNLWNSHRKRFYLHYNFPPYSVGEVGRFGGQSRREIGHGFLAEKALKPAIPTHENFPYTLRIVSEVFESNGSSSMGTVCSGMMALLDAGVPVQDTVAGIAMGLIKEKDKVVVLSDILGDEDHLGDMDFKVAGSEKGITALQMDIKIDSIDFKTLEQALNQALEGRIHILKEMQKTISSPNNDLSPYAPRIQKMQIPPHKVREVIGSGGKTINGITADTGAKVDIQDDGTLFVSCLSAEGLKQAVAIIEGICAEAEVGKIYEGKVVDIRDFGAIVEILPKTSGLLHISKISHERIDKVSDVFKKNDKVKVKVVSVDSGSGKISLSSKGLLDSSQKENK